jgi:hypothetical protein
MADHGEVEYATATGNDYAEHEATYEAFIHLTVVGILNVISILIGLTLGGVMGHWLPSAVLIVLAAIATMQGLVFNSRTFSIVITALAFVLLAVYGLG